MALLFYVCLITLVNEFQTFVGCRKSFPSLPITVKQRNPCYIPHTYKFKLYHNVSCSIRFIKQIQVPLAGLMN